MVFGQTVGARAQDCAALKTTATTKLDDFLEKRLAFEISSKKIQLIEKWRTEYDSNHLLNDQWEKANDAVAKERIAMSTAEVIYDQALNQQKTGCPREQ